MNEKEILDKARIYLQEGRIANEQKEIMQSLLNLYTQAKKDLLFYKCHLYTSVCANCGKEFNHKRYGVTYCESCSRILSYQKWKSSLIDEKLNKRRNQCKLTMQQLRAKNKYEKEKNKNA